MPAGYYRFPTIHQDTILFVTEDDLWSVPRQGGMARRLTTTDGIALYPALSPDGTQVAYISTDEGPTEVYVMETAGGRARRLTYLGSDARVLGWTPAGNSVVFSSNSQQPFARAHRLFSIPADSTRGEVVALPYGPARTIAFGPAGQVVLGRFSGEPANWKRYRGGTAGQLWIDREGKGEFRRFMQDLGGNITAPMWLTVQGDERIYFASDHEGVGNLYSCRPDGSDIRRHTDSDEFYVRNPSSDGRRIVYHAGADLFVFDPLSEAVERVDVDFRGPRVQRNRRFVEASRFLDNARLHPSGRALAVTSRGKAFAFYTHDGPVMQYGSRSGVRYRLPEWLNGGQRFLLISDEPGEERLEIYSGDPGQPPRAIDGLDLGRPVALKASPAADVVAMANHRSELLLVDVREAWGERPQAERVTVVDRSLYGPIAGFDWSPDGQWIAYGCTLTPQTTAIKLYRLGASEAEEGAPPNPVTITRPLLRDVSPAFDPEGNYLYFLGLREFNPVSDTLHFDLGFPWGMRPYLITLRADLPNPLVFHPELETDGEGGRGEEGDSGPAPVGAPAPNPADSPDGDKNGDKNGDEEKPAESPESAPADGDAPAPEPESDPAPAPGDPDTPQGEPGDGSSLRGPILYSVRAPETLQPRPAAPRKPEGDPEGRATDSPRPGAPKRRPVVIDLDGIHERLLVFPVPDARYGQIQGIQGKVYFTTFDVQGALENDDWDDSSPHSSRGGTLRAFSLRDLKSEVVAENVNWFELSRNRKKLLYASNKRLRVIDAGDKAPGEGGPARRSGWIDLHRVRISVDPLSEWQQMFREAWRLQRDHFWSEDMQQLDWHSVFDRYYPLLDRVSTRFEFSDLIWEMQGELGTSHTYEYGGDFRVAPSYSQGLLGASFRWDAEARGYRIGEIVRGDAWDHTATSPLAQAGIDVREGDLLVAINGQMLDENLSPGQLLVSQANQEVLLTFAARDRLAQGKADGAAEEHPAAAEPESVVVRTLRSELPVRYRAWVEENRRRVHAQSQGRVGYVHIPDMGAAGYAEFHRGFLAETDRDGLVVDVRYNSGGFVSALILEKLSRRRIGYSSSRWGGIEPYPNDSPAGPQVALTNESAGSDADIFCHSFKLLKLGPLVGKRTWGGVIGISPRHPLVDGTTTTQPEFAFWFEDVGWQVENYGTDPDIDVDILPQDYAAGRDPQLERAVAEALRMLEERPVRRPDFAARPSRATPKLPPRMP